MPRKYRTSQFPDIAKVLTEALNTSGGTFRCESRGQAVKWSQRAYQFRIAWSDEHKNMRNPYDVFKFVLEANLVHIKIVDQPGDFIPNEAAPAKEKSDLELAADEFAETLRKGGSIL